MLYLEPAFPRRFGLVENPLRPFEKDPDTLTCTRKESTLKRNSKKNTKLNYEKTRAINPPY